MECSKCGYIYNGVENISNCPKCGQNFGLKEEEGLSGKSKAAVAVGAAAGAIAGIANLAAKEGKLFASTKSDKKSQGNHENAEEIFSDTNNESSNTNDSQVDTNDSNLSDNLSQGSNEGVSNPDDSINIDDPTRPPVSTPGINDGSTNEDTPSNEDKPDNSKNEDTPSNEDKPDDSTNEDTPSNEDKPDDSTNEDAPSNEDKPDDSTNEDTPSNEDKPDDSTNEDTPSNEDKPDDSIDEDTPSNEDKPDDSTNEDTPNNEDKPDDSIDEDTPSNEDNPDDSIDEDTPSNEEKPDDSIDEDTPSNEDKPDDNKETPGNGGDKSNNTTPQEPETPTTPAETNTNYGDSGGGGTSRGGGVPDVDASLSDVETVLAMLGSSSSLMTISSGKGFADVYSANGSEYSDIGGVLDAVVEKSASLSKYVTPFDASSVKTVLNAVGGGNTSGYASELAGKVENLKSLLGKLYGDYELAYNLELQNKLYKTDPTTGKLVPTDELLELQRLGINTSNLDEDVYSFTTNYFDNEVNKLKSGDMNYKDSYLYKAMNDPTLTAQDIIKHYQDFTDQISATMLMLGTAGILNMTTTYGETDTTLSQFVDKSIYDGMNDTNKSDLQRYLESMRMNDVTSKNPGLMTEDDKKFLNTMNDHTENIREEYQEAQNDIVMDNRPKGSYNPYIMEDNGEPTIDPALQAEYEHVFNLTAIAANNLCFTTTVSEVVSARNMNTDRVFKGAEERTIEVNGKLCIVPARDELANKYCDLYLDMMGDTSTQRITLGGIAAENFYLQHQLNDVVTPNWNKANEEYLGLYENGYRGLAEEYGITDLNSLKNIDEQAYKTLRQNENLFDKSGELLPGLNSDDIALAYAKYNAEKELNNFNELTADMIVFSNFAQAIDAGDEQAISTYTGYMDNPFMNWEDMTIGGKVNIPDVINAEMLNNQLVENEANRLDTLSSYEDVYRGTIQKEMAANDEAKNKNFWSQIGLAFQQYSLSQSGGFTVQAVESQMQQTSALAEQQMGLAGENSDLKARNNALNNIVQATNIKIEEIGYELNVNIIQKYSDYSELSVSKLLPTNTLDLNELKEAVRNNIPQGNMSEKEYEQLVNDTADYQLALNIFEKEKNGDNVNLLFYSKDVRNYVENLKYYQNNRSAEDLQKMIGAMNYTFNKAYENGNPEYAFKTFGDKFNTINESGFQLEAQARAEWILTNQAGKIKDRFMESFMDYEAAGMTDAFGMTAALLSVAEGVEHIVDTTIVPFCFGVQSFGRGLIRAVTNSIEYVAVDLGVGEFYENIFEAVPGLEYMPGMQVGRFLANYDPPKHTTSMGDAVFGYMSSAVNNGEYGFNKLDSISMQAFQSIGNMAIPMIVSGVCQPLGSALLFTSAYGNTFEQSRIDGMNPHAALVYSVLSAGTEMVMERVLGGMPNMGKAASAVGKAGFVKSMFSEAREEMLQEFIDPFLEDVAYAIFPQKDAKGNIEDEGLRGVFSLDYWEHYIKEDFDPEAIAMAGIVAMFSAGVTNSGKLKTAIKSEMNYGIDIALGNKAEVYNNIQAMGYSAVQSANIVNALYTELGNLSKTTDVKADIDNKVSDLDLANRKLEMNKEYEFNKLEKNNKYSNETKIEKAKEIETKYKDLGEKVKEVKFDVDDKKQRKELKEALEMLDPDRSEVTDKDLKFQLYMEQMVKTIPNLETLLAQVDAEIPKFKNMLLGDLEKEERQTIQEQLNALEAKRKEIIKDIKSIKNDLNAELEKNKSEIDKLSEEALEIQEKLKTETDNDVRTQLETELSQKMAAIEELQNANSQVNTKLGETTIPDLENRIKSLNEELAKLNEQESKFDENTPQEVRQQLETERTSIQNQINQSSKRLVNALQDANNKMIEGLNEINNRNKNNNNNTTEDTATIDGPKPKMPRVENLEEGVVRTITENQKKIKDLEKQGIYPNGSPVKMSPETREVVKNVQTMNNIVEAGTDLLNNQPSSTDGTSNSVSTASVGTSTHQVAANVDTMNNIVGTGNAIIGVASGGATVGALIGGIKSGILDLETKIKNFDKNGNNQNINEDGTRDTRTRKELKKELHEKRQMLGKIENSLHEYSMTENSPLKEFLDQMNSEIRDMELGKFDSEKVAEAYEVNIATMNDKTAAQLKAQVNEFIKAINSINYSNMTFDQKLSEKFSDVQTLFDTLMNKIDFTESLSAVESIIKTLDIDSSSQSTINTKLNELTEALTKEEANIREYNSTFDSSKLAEIKMSFNTINTQIEELSAELSKSLSVLTNNYGNLAINIETSGVSAMTAENIKSISDLLGVVYESINGTYSYFDSLTKLTEITDMSKNHLKYMNVFKVSNEFNEMVNKFKNGDIDFDEFKVKLNSFSSGFNTVMNTYYSIDSTAFETVEPNTIVKNQTSIKDVFSLITTSNLSEAFELLKNQIGTIFVDSDAKKFEFITGLNELEKNFKHLLENTSTESVNTASVTDLKAKLDGIVNSLTKHINNNAENIKVTEVNGTLVVETSNNIDAEVVENIETATEQVVETASEEISNVEQFDTNNIESNISELEIESSSTMETLDIPNFETVDSYTEEMSVPEIEESQNVESVETVEQTSTDTIKIDDSNFKGHFGEMIADGSLLYHPWDAKLDALKNKVGFADISNSLKLSAIAALNECHQNMSQGMTEAELMKLFNETSLKDVISLSEFADAMILAPNQQLDANVYNEIVNKATNASEVAQENIEVNEVEKLSTEDIVESQEVETNEFKQPEVTSEEVKVEAETVNVEQKVVTFEQLKNEVLDLVLNAEDTDVAFETFAKKITDMLETDRSTVKEFFNAEGIKALKLNILAKCDYKTVETICEQLLTYKSAQEVFTIAFNADYINSIQKTEGFNQILWSTGVRVIERIKLLYIARPAVMNILKSIAQNNTEFANANKINDYLSIITSRVGHAKQRLYQENDLDLSKVVEITDKLNARVYLTHSVNKIALDLVVNQFISNINSPQIPTMLKNCLDSIEFHDARNPLDYYWATQYGAKNILIPFLSAATGGYGTFTSWALSPATLATVSHELGHSFDTKYAEMLGYSTSFYSKINPTWQRVIEADGKNISSYGKNSLSEDFAETMSMFVTNRTKLQKQFPNRYNQLVSMMREYAAYTLDISNVTDTATLRDVMIKNGIDTQIVDNILNSGHSIENIKTALVDYVAFTDDIQTTLETMGEAQVLTSESIKTMSVEDVVKLANSDLDSIPTIMKSGNYEFLQNPDLSNEAFAQAIEYMKSENRLSEITNISIDVGTNIQKAFIGFMNNLHIKTDSSIDLELQAKLLNDVMLNPNSQISDIKMVSGFLTTMGYIKSPITVRDLTVAKNLLDAGYANIKPSVIIHSSYSQLLQEKIATTYTYETKQIINQLVANKSNFIGDIINSKNISVVQGLMRNISQFDIDGIDFIFSKLNASSVPNLTKLLFDGIGKYSNETPYLTISEQRMKDIVGITSPNLRDYVIKKTFEVLFENVGYNFNNSPIIKEIAKSFGNGFTPKDAYWGLAVSYKQAKSNLYRQAIGLRAGEVINNAGVKVRVYEYSTNRIMKDHLNKFNREFNKLPPVYKNCAQYMGLHAEICELNIVEIIKNNGKPTPGEYYGYNFNGTRQIELFNGQVGLWNIAHEIGHIFDSEYSDLLAGVRSNAISYNPFSETGVWSNAIEQDALLSQNRHNPFGKYVSQYGKDSVEVTHVGFKEDFCDSMAKFFTDRERFLEQFPNRAKVIISMMYDFTSMKYDKYLTTEQGLRDLLQLFNEDSSQVDALLKNYSFEATRDAVIEHITFGSEMNPNLNTMRDLATQLGTANATRAIYTFNIPDAEITAPLKGVVEAVNTETTVNAGYVSNVPSQVSNLNDVIDVINAMGRNPQNIINAYIQTGNINLFTRTSGVRDFVSQYTVSEFESMIRNQNSTRPSNKPQRLTQFDYVEFEMRKGNYAVLNDPKLSYETLKDSILHLYRNGKIEVLNEIGLHVTDKRIVNGLISLGVDNFTVSPELYDFTVAKFMKEKSIIEMADLMETFLRTNNPIINSMFNSKVCSIEDMLRILSKVSTKTFNEISSKYFTFDYKLQLFEKLDYYNFEWLLNVNAKTDPVAHRNANIFFNKLLSDISNEIISKIKVREFIPFLPNSIVDKIRMSSPSKYVNKSDNEVIKVITDAKSLAEYELIKIGYGMSTRPVNFNGVEVRFFANNKEAHQNLLGKFDKFKKIYNSLPSTFRDCLTQMNFLDMSDPDNDSYSIDTYGNILFRFTAAGAGGHGKFYLWNNAITTNLMAHEIAHSLDTEYAKLKLGSEGFYTELNNNWQKAVERDNRRVTKYGDTNLQEDFAESVAIYMEHRESFARKYPNRTAQIEAMLRDLTVIKNGLENITTMRDMANKLIECKVPKAQILDLMKQGYNVEQLKTALIDHLALGMDMYDALASTSPVNIRQATSYNPQIENRAINTNNRKGVKSWFNNKFFNQNVQTSSPMVNEINHMIATQGVANITIRNAADISVSELRQISDLNKVNIFVSGIFSDINGNIKPKYNNPRYIARHTYTGVEMLSINAKLDQLQSRIDMSLPVKERARQIYELIASEYSYMKGYNESEYTYLVSQSLRGITSNNIVGRQGLICAGFASVFKELCTRCDITCDYIRGDVITDRLTNSGGRHAWNVVIDTNGEVIPVDCCWRSGGGKDYFGKSDMFAKDRYADADEAYKDYAKPYDEYQAYNMIDFAVRTMDMKYGPGAGIKALRGYLKTGNLNLMTSTNGARQTLSQMSFEDISDYIKANAYSDLSIYESQIGNIYESMAIRHRSYEQATEQLVEYIRTGNVYLITSYNGARDAISNIPVEMLKQFVNTKLNGTSPVIASRPRNMSPYKSQKTSIFNGIQNALQDSLNKFREAVGNININNAESSGLVTIERNPARVPYGQSEKNLINSSDGDIIFKKTTENESFAEVIGYEIAKSIDLSSARYDFATMDGNNGVVSHSIEQQGFEFKRANQLLTDANQSYNIIVHKFESIANENIQNSNLDVKKQTIKELIELSKRLKLQESTLFETIDVESITEYNFGTIYTDLTSAINTKINEYSTTLDRFNTNQINVSDITTLIDILTNTTDMNINAESVVPELTKMFIYDSVLYPGFRPLGDWGMMYNQSTGELTFAPLYDNSSICGLDGTVSTISDERLNMLKDLIDKSDSETISMIKDTLSKFNTEEITKIFEQIESQYGKQIPSEIRTTVVQSIEANMERINQLFEDNSSNGNSSPGSSQQTMQIGDETVKVIEISDSATPAELENAIKEGFNVAKIIIKYKNKSILLRGEFDGEKYTGFYKHIFEIVKNEKLIEVSKTEKLFDGTRIIEKLNEILNNQNYEAEVNKLIEILNNYLFNNNSITDKTLEGRIDKSLKKSSLPQNIKDALKDELMSIIEARESVGTVASKEKLIETFENTGLSSDSRYSELYNQIKNSGPRITIEELIFDGKHITFEEFREILISANLKIQSQLLSKYLNRSTTYQFDIKELIKSETTKSVYEIIAREKGNNDGNVDMVIFHMQETNKTELAERVRKNVNREYDLLNLSKLSIDELIQKVEELSMNKEEAERELYVKEIYIRQIAERIYPLIKDLKQKVKSLKDQSAAKIVLEVLNKPNRKEVFTSILNRLNYDPDMNTRIKDLISKIEKKDMAQQNNNSTEPDSPPLSMNAGAVAVSGPRIIEVSDFNQFTINELFSNKEFKDVTFKVGDKTYSLIEYSIRAAFEKGRLAVDTEIRNKVFELDAKLKEEAAKHGKTLKEYGQAKETSSELMKSLETPAKSLATQLYEKAKTAEISITENVEKLQIDGAYLTGLEYRLKSIDSISRKLISKSISKDNLNVQEQSLEKSSESMGDLIRYTLILNEQNYTEGVKKSLEALTKMGYEVIDIKNAWDRDRNPKYQGINVGLMTKDGIVFELQFHTELSFITKETLTHEYYEVARNEAVEPENRVLADKIQSLLQKNVIVPDNVETIDSFEIKIVKDINDLTIKELNKAKNPQRTTYRINGADYTFNEVKTYLSFKEGTIFEKETMLEEISKIDPNLIVEQISDNEYVVKNQETGKYVSFIAGDTKGILKTVNINDAMIHCIKQEIDLSTYFTEEQINEFNRTHQLVLRDVLYDSESGNYIRIVKDRLPVTFDISKLNKLLERYSLDDQKILLNSLTVHQRIEYLSNIEGMKIKNEILSTIDPSYTDIEKARKLYVELAKRVTYDANYMKTQSPIIYNKNVSFENLTDNNIICKGWAELYYELLVEIGFNPEDVKIESATNEVGSHKWIVVDLHNGKKLVADAAESIMHGSDMSHAKYGGKLVGFVMVNNAQAGERLRDLLYTDIDYYQSLLAEVKFIDKKIGYIKGQTYTGEVVQKAKKLFNFSFKKDKNTSQKIALQLFDTPITEGSSGLDVYLYYEKLIRYNNLNMNELDVQYGTRIDDNGKHEFYALLTSDNNQTYMVYTQSLGRVKFNSYNEYIKFLQEKGIH